MEIAGTLPGGSPQALFREIRRPHKLPSCAACCVMRCVYQQNLYLYTGTSYLAYAEDIFLHRRCLYPYSEHMLTSKRLALCVL